MSSDFDIPIELWRERMGKAADKIVLAAGLEHNMKAGHFLKQVPHDLGSFRGFMAGSLHRGADQIYLFNFMDSGTRPVSMRDYRILINEGASLETVVKQTRRHIVCYRDTVPPGFPNDMVLPAEGKVGFKLYIGPRPTTGHVHFVLGLDNRQDVETAAFVIHINGLVCQAIDDLDDLSQLPDATRALRYDCPPSAVQAGYNMIEVTQQPEQPSQRIVWAELSIKP